MLSGSVVAMNSEDNEDDRYKTHKREERYKTADGDYCRYTCNAKNEIISITIYSQNGTRFACQQADGTWIQTTTSLNGKIEKQETLSSRPDLPPLKKSE